MRLSLLLACAMAMLPGVSYACGEGLPATGSRDDVIVLVNDNAKDSCDLAVYYAQKRSLGQSNIVEVAVPANPVVDEAWYFQIRDKVYTELKNSVSNLVACSDPTQDLCSERLQQIKDESPIKYVVLTKGIPARADMSVPGPAGAVDGMLRFDLGSFLSPARLDGLTLESAKAQIDRALAVEAQGFSGNVVSVATSGNPGTLGFNYGGYNPPALSPSPLLADSLMFNGASVSNAGWRYFLGVFNETDALCTGNRFQSEGDFYLQYAQGDSQDRDLAPSQCKVKYLLSTASSTASEAVPGSSTSRVPLVTNASVYFGHLDGQGSLAGNFDNIRNWVKNSSCQPKLCDETSDPTACKAASTDVYRELDTSCIGVADGFIGFNFISWPLAYYTSWPTGWHPMLTPDISGSKKFGRDIGGDSSDPWAYPQVVTDDGDGDSYSLWFGAHDRNATTTCTDPVNGTPEVCPDKNRVLIGQVLSNFTPLTGLTQTKYYRVSLSYKSVAGEDTNTDTLKGMIVAQDPNLVVDSEVSNNQIPLRSKDSPTSAYGVFKGTAGDAVLGQDSGGWKSVSATFVLDPAVVLSGTNKSANKLSLILTNSGVFSGLLGIDNIVVEEVDINGNVISTDIQVTNPSFAEGHSQFAIGDWASTFTNRLNGVGFWGSSTHYSDGGYTFVENIGDSLAHFIAGDALAKAVWSDVTTKYGGMLYGDPLYSPIAIRINPYTNSSYIKHYDYIPQGTQFQVTGSTFNGNSPASTTVYSLDLCASNDFYTCDREGGWQSLLVNQPGGFRDGLLLNWDMSALAPGSYVLRVSVDSPAMNNGEVHNNFYSFTVYDPAEDDDGDGLDNNTELTVYGTDPGNPDTNGDGYTDSQNIQYPCLSAGNADPDGDGVDSLVELQYPELDPCVPEDGDSDGDGQSDIFEIMHNSDPNDPTSFFVAKTGAVMQLLLD